jgi:hypothetical protein
MYFINTHLGKKMDTFILSEEKHVKSVSMGTNHPIPPPFAELLHRQ